jgi:hypothetical protein
LAKRIAFRFGFVYLVLFTFPFPFDGSIAFSDDTGMWYGRLWARLAPWIGAHVLHLSSPVPVSGVTGSGDRMADWVQIFTLIVLAGVATLVWSLLDRRRRNYAVLHEGLRILLRWDLLATMMVYGWSKVLVLQFPSLTARVYGVSQLVTRFGDLSPMGLVWRFMGASPAYTIFAGAGEVVGAALLFWRRTTSLGALILSGVLLNVVMLNFCYDVPVKIGSTHLLAMSIVLLLPDFGRLGSVLITHRPVAAANVGSPFPRVWMRRTALGAAVVLTGLSLFFTLRTDLKQYRELYGAPSVALAVQGSFSVETSGQSSGVGSGDTPGETSGETSGASATQAASQATAPSPAPATSKWRYVEIQAVGDKSFLALYPDGSGPPAFFLIQEDAGGTTITVPSMQDPQAPPHVLSCHADDADHITLEGTLDVGPIDLHLARLDDQSFLLVGRGFHWVNEAPFNR